VERFYRTIQDGLVSQLAGFSDQHDGLKSAKKSAIPWPVLPRLVSQYFAHYHAKIHSELHSSPWEAWHDKLALAKGLLFNAEEVVNTAMVRRDVPVHRKGVHLDDGNLYTGPELTGLVDSTITVRISPEKPYDRVEAYLKDRFLGLLHNARHSPEIAQQIKDFRLQCTIELQSLSKILKSMTASVLPSPSEAPPGCVEPPADQSPQPVVSPNSIPTPDAPLAEIPIVQLEPADY
jgi:hypothetical protein